MTLSDRDLTRAKRGGRNRPAVDFVERVLCPSCGKTKIKTTEYLCCYCMNNNQQLDPPKLAATKPRYVKPRTHNNYGISACSRCPDNIRLMCRDRCDSGRHVLCEIPTEEELRMEHATTQQPGR